MDTITNSKQTDRKKLFSIVTPCFNSSSSIRDVFISLQNLNNQNFEWIVVNDASTDHTLEILNELLNKATFPVTIFNLQENQMATYCYFLGISKATGVFTIFLDHDDQIKSNALDRFLCQWDLLSNNQKDDIAGMIALCEDENGKIVGTKFPRSPDINSFFNLIFDERVRGEKFFCYKTSVMKENNFQLVDRYVPESTVMWRISSKYNTLFFNEALRIYNQPAEEGANLSNLDSFEYPIGFRLNYLYLLNYFSSQLAVRPYLLLAFLFNFSIYAYASGIGPRSSFLDLRSLLHRLIFFPIYILARIFLVLKGQPSK